MAEGPSDDGTTAEWGTGATFGHYRLIRLLGSGGFGEVYEAFDTRKSRTVALKLLPPSYSGNPIFRKRLFREASTAGRLNEPHVVPIHDYGEIDGQLYIDMRLVRGSDLRGVLDESGPMEPARAVRIVDQIASALDAAHAEQIIHRDVKPANILLTGHDFACLVDFGLANAATDAKLTTAGNTVGTFAYMSPERLADEEIDLRTDVYALTCVLYECLTGTPPFPHADLAALIAAHLTAPIPSPSRQRPGIAHQFDEVVTCGMAKDREDRYASAGALAAAAAQALAAEHPDTVSAPSGPANPLPPSTRCGAADAGSPRWSARSPSSWRLPVRSSRGCSIDRRHLPRPPPRMRAPPRSHASPPPSESEHGPRRSPSIPPTTPSTPPTTATAPCRSSMPPVTP